MSMVLRSALWWMLGGALTLAAGEAEHVRRAAVPAPGVCIASSLLLQGTDCRVQSRALPGDLL